MRNAGLTPDGPRWPREDRQAVVQYDTAKTSSPKIIEAIEKIGYKASIKK